MSAPAATRLPLCADVSRSLGEDPIGTAPHWQEVTVLELDVAMWSVLRDASGWTAEQAEVFSRLRDKVEASGAGFGLLMSAPQEPGQALVVRHYTRGAVSGGFTRRDYQTDLPQTEWARGLRDTLLEPHNLADWTELYLSPSVDMHVCTHGTVDAACGKYGVPVYQRLRQEGLSQAGLNAWRTGHFGGHRLAATAVELPSGLLWAHLTPELAVQVARRSVSPAAVRSHLRGYAGLPPKAQLLDRELFVQHGWSWLDAARTAVVSGPEVTLSYVWQGRPGQVRALVEHSHSLSLPGSSHAAKCSEVRQFRLTWQ